MESSSAALVIAIVLAVFAIFVVVKTAVVVPQQNAFVVERLGKFNAVLDAGFHILLPFIDAIRYKHTLKEQAIDIPEQICITNDNVQVGIDGLINLKVLDPQRASYGISDYYYAISQLAQTALRSEIGKITLDRTFEERGNINAQLVTELDKASAPWGIKVLRYEIKNITPTPDVLAAMEADTGRRLRRIRVDGGAAANDLLLQFQADILGRTILRPRDTASTTALGAAFLAGLAAGIFHSPGEIRDAWQEDRRFHPAMARAEAARRLARWHAAVEKA